MCAQDDVDWIVTFYKTLECEVLLSLKHEEEPESAGKAVSQMMKTGTPCCKGLCVTGRTGEVGGTNKLQD